MRYCPVPREFVTACRDAGIKTALGSASKNSMDYTG